MIEKPKTKFFIRVAKRLLLFTFTLYVILCATMAIYQRSFIYHPAVYSRTQVDQKARAANLERWTNSTGQFIGFKRLSPKQPADGTVLITYGNGSTATGCAHYADDIQKVAAFDVYILEYPGYEDRPGKPTEKSLFAAADDAFESLPTNHPIYLVGESLGSGVASYLAGTFSNKISSILLISPFNSVTAVAQHRYPFLPVKLLLVDRFASENYLQNYHDKVGISVDGKDWTVPEKFGLRLYNGYAGPKKLWQFSTGGHCQILGSKTKFWNNVVSFWQSGSN